MTTTPQSAEAQEREALLDAMKDMLNGWKYIRSSHGDLYGVGWDRAQEKMENAIASIEARASLPSAAASGEAPTVKDSLHVAPTPAVEGLTASMPTLTDEMRDVITNTGCVYQNADELYEALCQAASVPMASSAGEPASMIEQVAQPLYDLAWKHGARQHVSFAGDELESLSFTPSEFEAFCAELAPPATSLREQEEPDAVAVMYPLPNGRWDVKIVEWSERPKTGTGYQLGQRYRVIDAKRLGREKGMDADCIASEVAQRGVKNG